MPRGQLRMSESMPTPRSRSLYSGCPYHCKRVLAFKSSFHLRTWNYYHLRRDLFIASTSSSCIPDACLTIFLDTNLRLVFWFIPVFHFHTEPPRCSASYPVFPAQARLSAPPRWTGAIVVYGLVLTLVVIYIISNEAVSALWAVGTLSLSIWICTPCVY